jgi:SulP family sulfate permease
MFRRDLIAGLTVAAIEVPQGMAYALVAGIKPEYGLYTAIVPTFLASIFGSSSHLISGPTNAIAVVVFSAVATMARGQDDATHIQIVCLLALMVGFIQLLIALLKLGDLTRYVSESVIIGFTTGAALLIALGQVHNLLGLKESGEEHPLGRLWTSLNEGGSINHLAVIIGLGTILLILAFRQLKVMLKVQIPDLLLALLLAAFAVWAFDLGKAPGNTSLAKVEVVAKVEPRFPPFALPPYQRGDWIRQLANSAFAIALLGLIESLAIAKSIALRTRQPLDYNRQCLADGLANIGGSMFHCMPASGSLTRSAINYHAGAVTRLSSFLSALALTAVILLFAPLAHYVPKAALAGILFVTAWRLIDRQRLHYCLRATTFDAGLALATAAAALFIGIEFSILIGTFLSFMFFVPRAARLQVTELVVGPDRLLRERLRDDPECTKMVLFSLEGELFFGAAPELDDHFAELTRRAEQGVRVVVLRVKRARNPDMVCLERLQHFLEDMHSRGVTVLLSGLREDFAKILRNMRFHHWLPPECVFMEEAAAGSATLRAVKRAYEILGTDRCPTCPRSREVENGRSEWYYII